MVALLLAELNDCALQGLVRLDKKMGKFHRQPTLLE